MNSLNKGVCAARGFLAGSGHAGIKHGSSKDDVALIVSTTPCSAAGVFTRNKVQADCVKLSRKHLENHKAQGIIVNSGNANAAAIRGMENALRQAQAGAKALDVDLEDMVVASTGVIGQELPVDKIEAIADTIQLDENGSKAAATAIMTTDTKMKEASTSFEVDGITCYIGGICKGSGMIHPNMGTMLCYITTDCAITGDMLQKALSQAVDTTFNCVSVDQDTSTNDMCVVLANGQAGNPEITEEGAAYDTFYAALHAVMESLAIQIAADGEGASRLVTVKVHGAIDDANAMVLAKSVVTSSLVKAAMFGADANCGRILCALGYSGADFDPDTVSVSYCSKEGEILVCDKGLGLAFDEDLAARILLCDAVTIDIDLHQKEGKAVCWGCDLTYEYVKINGEYRT